MSTEIVHTINSTGQHFNGKQWAEHCKVHRSGYIAFTYKDYQFNEFDVCMTPHTLTDYNHNGCQLRITTAESPNGRWDFGISYAFGTGGGGHAPRFISNQLDGYSSEKEAVFAAVKLAEVWLSREHSTSPEAKEFMAKIQEYKGWFDPRQLELF